MYIYLALFAFKIPFWAYVLRYHMRRQQVQGGAGEVRGSVAHIGLQPTRHHKLQTSNSAQFFEPDHWEAARDRASTLGEISSDLYRLLQCDIE